MNIGSCTVTGGRLSNFFAGSGEVLAFGSRTNSHASQKRWLDESQGHDSYLDALSELDRGLGALSGGFEYAEGWRRHLHLGFCDEEADPLGETLSANAKTTGAG